ncbi:hypothetical protein MNAN1_002015 [Malassezia nana]|uniref:DUF4604 domain-containing protein n=1 Tax=Malassezia nana TaxID=180528 RepID=A0AAF0J2E6_9BASI|nr:hypothetical protein MNAN1_002015 [Malassezia nana]
MPPASEEGSPLSAQEKKSLRYTQETPSFLRQLHAQVRGTYFEETSERERKRNADTDDPLLDWVAPGAKPKQEREQEDYHSDDDLAHAQIVVLKEGKHLSQDDYRREREKTSSKEPDPVAHSPQRNQPVAEAGARGSLRKSGSKMVEPQNTKAVMHDAKQWIRNRKNELRESASSAPPKRSRTKRSRPPGAGLSFSWDD